MCGFVGVLAPRGSRLRLDRLKPMLDSIAHRGPDDAGYLVWSTGRDDPHGDTFGQPFAEARFREHSPLLPLIDGDAGQARLHDERWDLFLGHRRLSILDLTPRGHQPMVARDRGAWISYNGEVYNFPELREELIGLGYRFSSRTDTEVVLAAYQEWGLDALSRFNGMFAFALWDVRKRQLILARDRYGIKPLYYTRTQDGFLFASEIKALLAYGDRAPKVDLLALNEYFSFQNVLSERTLFDGVQLLPPGTSLTIQLPSGDVSERRYWDFHFRDDRQESKEELQEELYHLIEKAVERQLVSDVPIGCYLSGGLDSGTVTALATRKLGRLTSFTGGFDLSEAAAHEQRFDERELAERMASLFQTEHYECVLHAGDMEPILSDLVWHLEDLRVGQCYPNYYLARLAGHFVKVVLSGAGGDELFGGYPWRYAAALAPDNTDYVRNYYRYWKRLVPNSEKLNLFNSDTVARLRCMSCDDGTPFVDHTLGVFRRVLGPVSATTPAEQVNQSLYFECKTFLHGLLVVEDKLSMAHSLESRLPLLDNDLVDFACRLPVKFKISGLEQIEQLDENLVRKNRAYNPKLSRGKELLRSAMERILPPEVIDARKQGFSAPDESWFRGKAEDFVRRVLLDPQAKLCRYLDQDFVREWVIEQHRTGSRNQRLLIWSLLSFELWLDRFGVVE
ncbi:MAG: asparagine synthase (glutamine-hydrolyzing) [Planctomycetes bacterium]|nr:asparagine synthase (glutamine-hydrolyzing) [Planctomycetota bacterium]